MKTVAKNKQNSKKGPITDPKDWARVDELIRNGHFIPAIKLYREITGEGLAESRRAVEARGEYFFGEPQSEARPERTDAELRTELAALQQENAALRAATNDATPPPKPQGRWRGRDVLFVGHEHLASSRALLTTLVSGAIDQEPVQVAYNLLRAIHADLEILGAFLAIEDNDLNPAFAAEHVVNLAERVRASAEVIYRLNATGSIEPDPDYADQDENREENTEPAEAKP
jgi:hypothetical protein